MSDPASFGDWIRRRRKAHQITTALPTDSMRQVFEAAEPVRRLRQW
jgi:hypothetical protein